MNVFAWTRRLTCGALLALVQTVSMAGPADPQSLEEVNVSRRMMEALKLAHRAMPTPPDAAEASMPSISRTILLLGYRTISTQRLRGLLKWSGTADPLFRPDVVPESGALAPSFFVFDRAQNWKVYSDDSMSIDVVWIPNVSPKYNHYIEIQWYRRDGDTWYLFKQDRRQIPGCNKWPLCLGDST